MPISRTINGAAVQALRELAGISQRELAKRCNVGHPTIQRIENGVPRSRFRVPGLEHRLAEALKVPVDAITQMADPADKAKAS